MFRDVSRLGIEADLCVGWVSAGSLFAGHERTLSGISCLVITDYLVPMVDSCTFIFMIVGVSGARL